MSMHALPRRPLVSVIMPAYNAAAFIRQAVESALAQTYSPLEVICVDDGSTDATSDILERFGSRITVLRLSHAGVCGARNAGIHACHGDWIAFLDADDMWDPCKVEVQLAEANDHDAVIHSNARSIDANGDVISPRLHVAEVPRFGLLDLMESNPVLLLTVIARRASLQAVGGFDVGNRLGTTEDRQVWLRLAARGYGFRYVDRVLASYRLHGSNASGDLVRMGLGCIYTLASVRRDYPGAFGKEEMKAYHKALHARHLGVGCEMCERGWFGTAFGHFCRAIGHNPFGMRAWVFLAMMCLPFKRILVPRLRALLRGVTAAWGRTGPG